MNIEAVWYEACSMSAKKNVEKMVDLNWKKKQPKTKGIYPKKLFQNNTLYLPLLVFCLFFVCFLIAYMHLMHVKWFPLPDTVQTCTQSLVKCWFLTLEDAAQPKSPLDGSDAFIALSIFAQILVWLFPICSFVLT